MKKVWLEVITDRGQNLLLAIAWGARMCCWRSLVCQNALKRKSPILLPRKSCSDMFAQGLPARALCQLGKYCIIEAMSATGDSAIAVVKRSPSVLRY